MKGFQIILFIFEKVRTHCLLLLWYKRKISKTYFALLNEKFKVLESIKTIFADPETAKADIFKVINKIVDKFHDVFIDFFELTIKKLPTAESTQMVEQSHSYQFRQFDNLLLFGMNTMTPH